jgi:RNA polymerase sigma factor (sigma-70 family)
MWLRDFCKGGWPVHNSEHFFAMAGRSMRRAMVEAARKDQARKRQRLEVQIDDIAAAPYPQLGVASHEQVIQLHQLMEQLAERDPKAALVVDLHHVHGLSFDDVAKLTGLKVRQVRYRWETGRMWLLEHLASSPASPTRGSR